MSVIFTCKRGPSSRLNSLAVENGAMIITTDTNELYMDVNSTRLLVGPIQVVDSLPSSGIISSRIYFLNTNNTFYKYIDSKWVNITNVLMTGATSTTDGKAGIVPAPTKSDAGKFLRGDGTWATPDDTSYGVVTTTKDGLMSSGDKSKLDGIASGAEVNQNAFSKFMVDSTPISANSKTDTVTLVAGTNVTLTPDAAAKTVTITTKDTTYEAATTSKAGLMSITDKTKLDNINNGAEVNQNAFSKFTVGDTTISSTNKTDTLTLVAGTNVTLTPDASGKKVTITTKDTTYSNATTSNAGLMSTDDKSKLDGIATGANKTVVDTAISATSTNPVQNKVIKAEFDTVNARIDDITNGADEALNSFKEFKDYLDNHQEEYEALVAISENKVDKVDGKGLSTNDFTTAYKSKLDGIATGAEVNQNAFSKLTVGTTTITSTNKTDTLTLEAGTNVTLTPDASGKKVTIVAKDTTYNPATTSTAGLMSASDKTKLDNIEAGANKYTHPTHGAKSEGMYKVTVDGLGHITAATAITKADITGLGIPAQDTTYGDASTTASGLMSASDKSKLDGIASGANKYTHPSYTAKSSGLYKVTVDASGHVSATAAVTKADITGLGIPAQDTTYSAATTSAAGLMSATDKTKLDSINTTFATDEQILALFA